jgi:hypothetical protein
MTDGDITLGAEGEALYSLIKEWNKDIKATIFTYSIGTLSSKDVPLAIACLGNGIYTQAQDTDNLREILADYYSILATGITMDHAIWTEPYLDANGLGETISVVYASYDRS